MTLVFNFGSLPLSAQFEAGKVMEVISIIRNLSEFSYEYKINIEFPDGQKDSVQGETYSSLSKGVVYNHSGLNTILYNGEWYLNADHIKKQVVIYPLQRRFSKGMADSLRSEIFQFQYYKEWMDSLVIQHGAVSGAILTGDKISYSITFKPYVPLRKIYVVFNLKKNMPERVEVEAVVEEDEEGKTISRIVCTRYKADIDNKKIALNTYCDVKNENNIALTKFKNYKLITLNR